MRSRDENVYAEDDSLSAQPYRLDVLTSSMREVIAAAGGWLADRTMAGWAVTIITDGDDDVHRAAGILGCEVVRRGATPDPARPRPYGIVVTAALLGRDQQVQKYIDAALRHGIRVVVIGARSDGMRDPRLCQLTHRLSAAALAFKVRALTAAGQPHGCAAPTERLELVVPRGRDVATTGRPDRRVSHRDPVVGHLRSRAQ